jgi:DNA-binding IclR family transcriptional regulator
MDFVRADEAPDPPLTPLHLLPTQQRRIIEAIDLIEQATGEPCSVPLLARRFRLHHSTVQDHVFALHRKGWLKSRHAPLSLRQRPR